MLYSRQREELGAYTVLYALGCVVERHSIIYRVMRLYCICWENGAGNSFSHVILDRVDVLGRLDES